MAISAIFDECGLQGRFDPGYLGKIYVSAQLLPISCFKVEFFNPIATHDDDPGLFRVARVDQHFVCHY